MTTFTTAENTGAYMDRFLALLATGESLPLPVLGSSMAPFLVHQRDQVVLKRADRAPKVGDICLYQRQNGAYVLHRVCRMENGAYTMAGDAQTFLERGIQPHQILALAVSARRKGRTERPGTLWWSFFALVWPRIIPLRPAILKLYSILSKPLRR